MRANFGLTTFLSFSNCEYAFKSKPINKAFKPNSLHVRPIGIAHEAEEQHDDNVPKQNAFTPSKTSTRRVVLSSIATATATATASTILLLQPEEANAITSSEAEISYDKYAKNYDALDGGSISNSLGIEEARISLLQSARGRVLEIGVGTGLNLGKYKFSSSPDAMDGVTSLTLVDISEGMMMEAKEKLNSLNVPPHVEVNFVKADATADLVNLFGSEGMFDSVVDTFSLCVMGNEGAKRCLEQMKNVVKKDSGRILLIENTRSSNAALGIYQDLTADAAAKIGGKGCVSNQNVRSYIEGIKGLGLISEDEFAAGVFRTFVCKRV